jgi:hypothetical protein
MMKRGVRTQRSVSDVDFCPPFPFFALLTALLLSSYDEGEKMFPPFVEKRFLRLFNRLKCFFTMKTTPTKNNKLLFERPGHQFILYHSKIESAMF